MRTVLGIKADLTAEARRGAWSSPHLASVIRLSWRYNFCISAPLHQAAFLKLLHFLKDMFWWACLALLSAAAAQHIAQPAVGVSVDKPWFCHDLDCPKYDLINRTDAYEVRKYQAGTITQWLTCMCFQPC